MAELKVDSTWVDRYLRDELSEAEEETFELALLESQELQDELETALALRQAVASTTLDGEDGMASESPPESPQALLESRGNWQPMALAASVLLAVFSTVMFWKVSNEAGDLERQLAELSQPMNGVLRINVDIMRSASNEVPDLVIQKPGPQQMIQLDIELTPQASNLAELHLALVDASGETAAAWTESGGKRGRVVALLRSTVVPDGRVHLEISDSDGNLIDRRLLEFRPDS